MVTFECKNAYHQIAKDCINNVKPMTGYAYSEVTREYHSPHVVGTYIESDYYSGINMYCFSEGEKHNRLTLTEDSEIENMRAYIKSRADDFIIELEEV